ncbi:hypothetical protein FJZ53_01065 [Candidatus Woesearchaeota archaeon]|nr:hypothetical protein [Candidatus Woesearchaeota archaeon]
MNAQQIEAAIRTSKEKCLFAEEFAVGTSLRSTPLDKKGTKVRKEGILKIFFLDAATHQVINEVAVTSITAKMLGETLLKNVAALEKELADDKPKAATTIAKPTYSG